MPQQADHNRRIALNTLLLYGRLAFTMGLGLFTTRALLAALGTVDFGLVNVIAGVVTLFGFLSASMNTATGRFFSFELGRGDHAKLASTFGLTRLVYLVLAALILALSEIGGLWILEHKLVIPPDRLNAAHWLFHGALLGFALSILTIPYTALVIAHENMRLFSMISILDAALKLGIALALPFVPADRLAAYGVLLFAAPTITFLAYRTTCRRRYPEARAPFQNEPTRFKELLGFSGWNLFGALSGVANGALTNVLLNLFFGPAVNAARGVAYQVSGAVSGLTAGFIQASAPQIVKYYAAGELDAMRTLVCNASRYGFLLLLIGVAPLLSEMEFVLGLWLSEVPEHTATFARLVLITALIDSLSLPLMQAAQATGRIALYQSLVGSLLLLNLPLGYLFLRQGFPATSVFYVTIAIAALALLLRLMLLRRMIALPIRQFIRTVLLPASGAGLLSFILLGSAERLTTHLRASSPLCLLIAAPLATLCVTTLGLNTGERAALIRRLKINL